MKRISNFCRTGKDVYEGIKEILNLYTEKSSFSREELVDYIKHLTSDRNLEVYTYKTWESSSDFIRFITNKLNILKRKDLNFLITKTGLILKKILHVSEENFKQELLKLTYSKSHTQATRFRDFCDFLKNESQKSAKMDLEVFNLARKNILKDNQFSNRGALYFLSDLDVYMIKDKMIYLNLKRISIFDPESIAIKILMDNLSDESQISIEKAKSLLTDFGIKQSVLNDLQIKQKIIIRTTRSGKYLDFN